MASLARPRSTRTPWPTGCQGSATSTTTTAAGRRAGRNARPGIAPSRPTSGSGRGSDRDAAARQQAAGTHTGAVDRSHRAVVVALLGISALLSVGCGTNELPVVTASGDHDGLILDVRLRPAAESIRADAVVRNTRDTAVHLDATQCGRVTEVILARTVLEADGASYAGSLDAVKQLLLRQQRSNQNDDPFAPRSGKTGSRVPACVRPTRPVTIAPGGSISESWELPFATASGLAEVGSDHMSVQAAAVESEDAETLRFIDILPPGQGDEARAGRAVSAMAGASAVVQRAPTHPNSGRSLGQRFDKMIASEALRTFIEARPVDSWRRATITPTLDGRSEFRAVTTDFETALRADLAPDGASIGAADIPDDADRARTFERRRATLPPGIDVIPAPDAPTLTDDVIAGRLALPSGRVVADASMTGEAEAMPQVAEPGDYRVFVTVGGSPGSPFEQVAFASLVVSDAPTVSWVDGTSVAVDGGTAGFTSAEGSERLALGETEKAGASDAAFDSLTAHDDLITEVPIGDGLDLALFTSGYGDGLYDVHVGLDANGKPTRYVMDFAIVHLGWPQP